MVKGCVQSRGQKQSCPATHDPLTAADPKRRPTPRRPLDNTAVNGGAGGIRATAAKPGSVENATTKTRPTARRNSKLHIPSPRPKITKYSVNTKHTQMKHNTANVKTRRGSECRNHFVEVTTASREGTKWQTVTCVYYPSPRKLTAHVKPTLRLLQLLARGNPPGPALAVGDGPARPAPIAAAAAATAALSSESATPPVAGASPRAVVAVAVAVAGAVAPPRRPATCPQNCCLWCGVVALFGDRQS